VGDLETDTERPVEAASNEATLLLGFAVSAYSGAEMRSPRTNDEWIRDLRSDAPTQTRALEELRGYLCRALPGATKRFGAMPEHLLDDVVQDALIRVLEHLDDFQGRSRFATWVTAIAVRAAMTELRRRRWKDVSLEELTESGGRAAESDVDTNADPERRAAQSRIVRAMQEILDSQLTERQRTAIVAELSGMPQEEIGRRLGITRNAVYKLGHDARKKLKRGLEASGFDAAEIRAAFSQDDR
jgi:RNA polymerase sigma-70 factor (ECF subfamily)